MKERQSHGERLTFIQMAAMAAMAAVAVTAIKIANIIMKMIFYESERTYPVCRFDQLAWYAMCIMWGDSDEWVHVQAVANYGLYSDANTSESLPLPMTHCAS